MSKRFNGPFWRTNLDSRSASSGLTATANGLAEIWFGGYSRSAPAGSGERDPAGVLERACAQLGEYFAGERMTFDLPLAAERHRVRARRLGAPSEDPGGADGELRRPGAKARRPHAGARGGPRQRTEPAADRGAVSSRDRRRRFAGGVRRRDRAEALAPGARGGAGAERVLSRIDVATIQRASTEIDPVFRDTPQFESAAVSETCGARVVLKVETRQSDPLVQGAGQPTGSASGSRFHPGRSWSARLRATSGRGSPGPAAGAASG